MALNPRYIFEHSRHVPGGGGLWLQMTEALLEIKLGTLEVKGE